MMKPHFTPEGVRAEIELSSDAFCTMMEVAYSPTLRIRRSLVLLTGEFEAAEWNYSEHLEPFVRSVGQMETEIVDLSCKLAQRVQDAFENVAMPETDDGVDDDPQFRRGIVVCIASATKHFENHSESYYRTLNLDEHYAAKYERCFLELWNQLARMIAWE